MMLRLTLRFIALALCAVLCLSGAHAQVPQIIPLLLGSGAPGWVLRGGGVAASVDCNFALQQYFGANNCALANSRNSVEYVNDANGNWTAAPALTAAVGAGNGLASWEQRTNSQTNNSNQGTIARDNVELLQNPTFNGCSGQFCTDGIELLTNASFAACSGATCSGWTVVLNAGTGSVNFSSGVATLVGDGTHQTNLTQSLTTVIGNAYLACLTVTTNPTFLQVGNSIGSAAILGQVAPVGTNCYQFTATATTTFVGYAITAAQTTTVAAPSVKYLAWITFINGTSTITFGSNGVTITGDGTNFAYANANFTTVIGRTYIFCGSFSANPAGSRMWVGTANGGAPVNNILTINPPAGSGNQVCYGFIATATTTFVSFVNSSLTPVTVTNATVQYAGHECTGCTTLINAMGGTGIGVYLHAFGVQQGIDYVEYDIIGIGTANVFPSASAGTNNSAVPGQVWTISVFAAVTAGNLTNVTSLYFVANYDNNANCAVYLPGVGISAAIQRFSKSCSVTQGNTQVGGIFNNIGGSGFINFRLWQGLTQLELNPNTAPPSVGTTAVNNGGNTFANSVSGTMTWSGAGCSVPPVFNVTTGVAGHINSATIATPGTCLSAFPSNTATTWTPAGAIGAGDGTATFTMTPVDNSAQGFVTPPIRTTVAAGTRLADNITFKNVRAPLTAVSLYGQVSPQAANANPTYATWGGLNDGTGNNEVILNSPGTNLQIGGQWVYVVGGSLVQSAQNVCLSGQQRGAVAVKSGSQTGSLCGSTNGPGSQAGFPTTMSIHQLGLDPRFGNLNGFLQRWTIWLDNFISQANMNSLTLVAH